MYKCVYDIFIYEARGTGGVMEYRILFITDLISRQVFTNLHTNDTPLSPAHPQHHPPNRTYPLINAVDSNTRQHTTTHGNTFQHTALHGIHGNTHGTVSWVLGD